VAPTWTVQPAVLALVALAALLFAQAFVRLRRRGRRDHAPWSRALLFTAALAALTLPLVSPLDQAADDYLLSAHMLEHVLIGDVAAALAVVALRGPLLVFFLPSPVLARLARMRFLRAAAAFLLRPWTSFAVWAFALAAWHVPAAYDYTLAHGTVHDLEHATFLLGGLLVWSQLVDPARRRALTPSGRLGYMGLMLCVTGALATVLIAAPNALYPAYAEQAHRVFSLSPLADQWLAGLVMLVEQLLTLGLCVVLMRPRALVRAPKHALEPL
jgi:putative membrane protein